MKVIIIQHKRDGLQSFFTLGNKGAKVTCKTENYNFREISEVGHVNLQ